MSHSDIAYLLTAGEVARGIDTLHMLSVADSEVLRRIFGPAFTAGNAGGGGFSQQIDCRKSQCTVKVLRNN